MHKFSSQFPSRLVGMLITVATFCGTSYGRPQKAEAWRQFASKIKTGNFVTCDPANPAKVTYQEAWESAAGSFRDAIEVDWTDSVNLSKRTITIGYHHDSEEILLGGGGAFEAGTLSDDKVTSVTHYFDKSRYRISFLHNELAAIEFQERSCLISYRHGCLLSNPLGWKTESKFYFVRDPSRCPRNARTDG